MKLEGGRGAQTVTSPIALPATYASAPGSLDGTPGANIFREYAALARDLREGTQLVPDFAYALRRHQLLAAIEEAARSGITQRVGAARA